MNLGIARCVFATDPGARVASRWEPFTSSRTRERSGSRRPAAPRRAVRRKPKETAKSSTRKKKTPEEERGQERAKRVCFGMVSIIDFLAMMKLTEIQNCEAEILEGIDMASFLTYSRSRLEIPTWGILYLEK